MTAAAAPMPPKRKAGDSCTTTGALLYRIEHDQYFKNLTRQTSTVKEKHGGSFILYSQLQLQTPHLKNGAVQIVCAGVVALQLGFDPGNVACVFDASLG
jgi:hypothetical protein